MWKLLLRFDRYVCCIYIDCVDWSVLSVEVIIGERWLEIECMYNHYRLKVTIYLRSYIYHHFTGTIFCCCCSSVRCLSRKSIAMHNLSLLLLLHRHPTRIENCSCVKITRQWFCPRQKHFVHLVMHYRYLFCCNRFHCYRFFTLLSFTMWFIPFYYKDTTDIDGAPNRTILQAANKFHTCNPIFWWTSEWTLSNRTVHSPPQVDELQQIDCRSSVAVCEIYEPNRIWTMYNRISHSVVNNHLLEVDVFECVHRIRTRFNLNLSNVCLWRDRNSNAANSKIIISHRIRFRSGSA